MSIHRSLGAFACNLILLSFVLAGCAPEDKPATETPEQMFAKDCGACHGTEGTGPSISELRALSTEELRAAIANHPTAGQIPDRLPAARVDDLITYLEEQ